MKKWLLPLCLVAVMACGGCLDDKVDQVKKLFSGESGQVAQTAPEKGPKPGVAPGKTVVKKVPANGPVPHPPVPPAALAPGGAAPGMSANPMFPDVSSMALGFRKTYGATIPSKGMAVSEYRGPKGEIVSLKTIMADTGDQGILKRELSGLITSEQSFCASVERQGKAFSCKGNTARGRDEIQAFTGKTLPGGYVVVGQLILPAMDEAAITAFVGK